MNVYELLAGIRYHVEDGLAEIRKARLTGHMTPVQTIGYLAACLRSIQAECDSFARTQNPVQPDVLDDVPISEAEGLEA